MIVFSSIIVGGGGGKVDCIVMRLRT